MEDNKTFNEEILRLAGELLESGELEAILREKVLKGFSEAFDRSLSWGKVRDAIEDRMKSVMVPYIENYDMGAYVVKLDAILCELLETSAVNDNKRILENFKRLMAPVPRETITLDEIFKEYCKFVAENIDTTCREVDTDDEPTYVPIEVQVKIEEDEKPRYFTSSQDHAVLYLSPTEEEHENLCFSARLHKWSWKDGYTISLDI